MTDSITVTMHLNDHRAIVKGYKGTAKGTGVFYWLNVKTEGNSNDLSIFADSVDVLKGLGSSICEEMDKVLKAEKRAR